MNVPLLREIVNYFKQNPESFIMSQAVARGNSFRDGSPHEDFDFTVHPTCGTACCIAGAALLLSGEKAEVVEAQHWEYVRDRAEQLLGLNRDQSRELFHEYRWPMAFSNQFRNAKNQRERLDAGIGVIEELIQAAGAGKQ